MNFQQLLHLAVVDLMFAFAALRFKGHQLSSCSRSVFILMPPVGIKTDGDLMTILGGGVGVGELSDGFDVDRARANF